MKKFKLFNVKKFASAMKRLREKQADKTYAFCRVLKMGGAL
jgi:hypothetical protein